MFGYVKTFTPQLKVCEHEYYKAVYCGLCKTLGKNYGLFSKLTLSYDFAFLSFIYADINNEVSEVEKCHCLLHPCKRKNCVKKSQALDFSAGCAMIMLYYKVLDNIRDSSFFKRMFWRLVLPFAKSAHKKAAEAYPNLEKIVCEELSRQEEIEKKSDVSPDEAADPTACVMKRIFLSIKDDEDFGRFGYLLGRFVYLIDAYDDFEKDKKSGNFNAFESQLLAKESCNLTCAELQNAYEKVEFKAFSPIISNVIFLGLNDSLDKILKRKECKNG